MQCPTCGQEMRDGWLMLTGAGPFVKVRWSPKRITWGPRLIPRDSHVVIGAGIGGRPREAKYCEQCSTVVVPPAW